ncbi:MAG TPA: hypothetical protein VGL20_04485 [Candidatus Dormibacteraeota bacterium]
MPIDEPPSGGQGWSIRETAPVEAVEPDPGEGEPPPAPAWAPPPPPPPRASAAARVTVIPWVLLLVAGAAAAVMLVRHNDGGLVTPDSIAGEHRLGGGEYDRAVSTVQDMLRALEPQITSVVFAAYSPNGAAGVPGHMVFAEKGVAQDAVQSLRAFTGQSMGYGSGAFSVGAPTVAASGGESFTCLSASGSGLPAMTMCFWSDASPANAGGVMCMSGSEVHTCADYAGVARRAVLGG